MNPVRFRPRRRHTSNGSLRTCSADSLRYWRKKNLGDKIHELARRSPLHVVALELLVNQILQEISR